MKTVEEMTLEKAYEITNKMTIQDHKTPTPLMKEAKWLIYEKVISKKYGSDNPMLEPDYNEGWR